MYLKKTSRWLLLGLLMTSRAWGQGWHEPSGLNHTFTFSLDTPFSEYLSSTQHMIESSRVDLTEENRARVIHANMPFELAPSKGRVKNGILLIHGLGDSPYQMRALGKHFLDKGFLVRSILLPGHGTVPGDLMEVTWESWVDAAEYGLNGLSKRVDNLFVGGFSTGGELALLMCLKRDDIKGVLLFSPVTGIETPFAWFSTTFLAPTWLVKIEEKDFSRYDSLPSNAVGQVYELTMAVDELIEEKGTLDLPVFVALSEQDITVDSDKTMDLFKTRFISPQSRMVVYSSEPKIQPPDPSGRITVVDSRIPREKIVSFSHLSILIPPDDPHYGKHGDYVYRAHPLLRQSTEDLEPDQVYYGELLSRFKRKHYIRRLTYNPYFTEMIRLIDDFFEDDLMPRSPLKTTK